jgi:hypothetical protein
MSFFDKMKKASKGVVDAGAKQMLKVRCDFFRCVALRAACCASHAGCVDVPRVGSSVGSIDSVLLAYACYMWAVPGTPKSVLEQ